MVQAISAYYPVHMPAGSFEKLKNGTDCEEDHANPFSTEVYDVWELLLKSLYFCMAMCREEHSPYPLITLR